MYRKNISRELRRTELLLLILLFILEEGQSPKILVLSLLFKVCCLASKVICIAMNCDMVIEASLIVDYTRFMIILLRKLSYRHF